MESIFAQLLNAVARVCLSSKLWSYYIHSFEDIIDVGGCIIVLDLWNARQLKCLYFHRKLMYNRCQYPRSSSARRYAQRLHLPHHLQVLPSSLLLLLLLLELLRRGCLSSSSSMGKESLHEEEGLNSSGFSKCCPLFVG